MLSLQTKDSILFFTDFPNIKFCPNWRHSVRMIITTDKFLPPLRRHSNFAHDQQATKLTVHSSYKSIQMLLNKNY